MRDRDQLDVGLRVPAVEYTHLRPASVHHENVPAAGVPLDLTVICAARGRARAPRPARARVGGGARSPRHDEMEP